MGLMIEIEKPEKGAGGDARAAAGKALAKALRGGDGAAIADAFDELRACCDEAEMGDDDEEDE
jgi:hypothetical protein